MTQPTGMQALRRAREIIGSGYRLAKVVKRRPSSVYEVLEKGRRVPAEWCIPIEQETRGLITRAQLRPDLFDTESSAAE